MLFEGLQTFIRNRVRNIKTFPRKKKLKKIAVSKDSTPVPGADAGAVVGTEVETVNQLEAQP